MQFRVRSKDYLKEDIGRLGQVFASIREAVIVADRDGKVIMANPASELIIGYPPHKLIGKRIQDVLPFKCAKADVSWFFSEALAGWRAVALPKDCSILRPTGGPLPVAATATPFYSSQGEYQGIVLVARDTSEEVRLKRRQYEFLSFVSHQLRQPFGSLRWGIEIILREKSRLSPKHQELLEDLLAITTRFADFIKDLVDISRFEEGRVDFKIEPVDIRKMVKEVAKELHPLAVSQNVSLHLFPGTDPQVELVMKGDWGRLHDVFSNLLANAIRYNRPRGTVTVEARFLGRDAILDLLSKIHQASSLPESLAAILAQTEKEKSSLAGPISDFLLISVSDSGIGIPKDQQANIFESFFRGKNVIEKGLQGTGLGIFIVKSIVERSGGRIFFESQENFGTTFYLVFPKTIVN